jgi:hypothetical protein
MRLALLRAVVEDLREHGRASGRDPDAFLVRLVLRTGLTREDIQRAATELQPLLRELARVATFADAPGGSIVESPRRGATAWFEGQEA